MTPRLDRRRVQVGETVYAVFHHRHNSHMTGNVVIEKVGRKWATFKRWRFSIDTGQIDGNGASSPGRIYDSESDYTQTVVLAQTWNALRSRVERTHACPAHLTLEMIEQIGAQIFPTTPPARPT